MSEMALKDLDSLANRLVRVPIRMDCFFVTLAFLLRTTVQDISTRIGIPVPAPGSNGVGVADVVNALTRLGMVFNVWNWTDETNGNNGGPVRGPNTNVNTIGVVEARAGRAVGMPRVVGAVYIRPDRTGHVVVCRNPGTPYRRYVDYQASTSGADATRDAQGSRIVAYFALDTDRTPRTIVDNNHVQQIEQMEVDEERAHPDEPMDWEDDQPGPSNPGPSKPSKPHGHDELRRARARRFRRF
ncbi:hypothetical protein ABW21_db0207979 [Orbilia brochopaga]|nr:hypothetical protein ABW21_db0207979 [Drechslerella brochopaga]